MYEKKAFSFDQRVYCAGGSLYSIRGGCSAASGDDTVVSPTTASGDGTVVSPTTTYYTVTFNSNGGTSVSSQTVENGKTATEPKDPTKDGYNFSGWYLDGLDEAFDFSTAITSNITLTAYWEAASSYYTVKHFLQPTSLSTMISDYEEQTSDTETLTGATGTTTSAQAKTYTGFTAQEITQGTITADGSTIVSIYYNRNTITLTLNLEGGNGTESLTGKYGTAVTAPENPTKTGYTFSSWSPELPETFPEENATYTAAWTANTYTVTFSANDESRESTTQTFTFGTSAALNANTFTRTGYTFLGWSEDSDSESATYVDGATYSTSASDTTLYAVWKANMLGSITASAPTYTNTVENFLTVDSTSDSTKITFTASDDYSSFIWYVDGDIKSTTGSTFTMAIDDYDAGSYMVMLIVDKKYSAAVEVAVSK